MEDAWHAKCSSAWPSTPPASTSIPSLPPLPVAPSRSPGPASQTSTSSGQFFHPFAQGTSAGNNTVLQEPMVFNTLNLDSYNPGKAELSSSFLALLSGRPNHTSSEFCRLPYSGSRLANLQVHGGGIVNGVSCGVSIKSAPPLSENHGNDANGNGELSTNFPIFHNNFQPGATNFHTPCKPISYQPCQGHSAGVGISSRTCRWPSVSSLSNAKQHNMLIQTTQKMPSEARASTSIRSSSTFRGRPRVFCMNKVGELFVSDIGLLGVLCFCHQLPMSVAKFCEHSGSPSANPGDAVHLENGMTVAQWRKLFFGVMTSDHGNRWDWSDASSSEGGSGGFPTSTKNSSLISSFEASGGLGNQKSGLHGHNFFTETSVSAQSTMPAFTKNNMVQVSKESPIFMGFEGSHLNLNQGKKNVESQLVANSVNYMGEKGKLPISFSRQNHFSRTYFPSERFVVDRDNISSNIELRLGHPSQKNNTTISCFPEGMNPIHLGSQNLQQYRRELGNNVRKDSESEDLMDDGTKSSLISFLSHLNTEGNYPSNSTDIEVLDSDSHYSKYNLSDSTWELTDGIERKSDVGNIDQGKGLRIAGIGSCATFKSNYSVHNKTKTDVRVISSATGGHCIHTSSANDRQSTVYFNQYNHAIHKPPSPFNSFLNSETSVTLSSKNSINADILQNTRDGSLESISLRHLERSPSSLGTSPLHRRPCCLPLPTEEPKDGPYCIVQNDASKINITLAHSFSNCYSGGDAQTSALNPDASSPFRCCDCSTSTQRHTLCSKEHGIQFSSCHVCHVDEQPCLRLKEESSSFSGKCYCIAPQFLPGCTLNEHGCGKAKRIYRSPDYDRVQYGGRVRLGQCECLRKNKSMKNNCHIALWRDVPTKAIGHSDATPNGKSVQVLQATHIAGDQLTGTAIKEPQQESESIREQQISNVSSGSSAPVVTEANNSKIMHDLVIDEGSGIEKCGSSDEAHDNRDHEDQLSGVCRGQAYINHIQESKSVNKAGKIKGPSKWSSFDASVPVLDFSSNYCESPDQAEEFDHPCEPDNAMQETGIYYGKSSVKRKRSALSSTKSSGKKAKPDLSRDGKKQQGKEKEDHMDAGKPPKFISLSCIGNTSDHGKVFSCQKARPVVCGNSGIIFCGLSGRQKPAKFVSLSLILKKSSRCPNTLSSRKLQSDNADSWGASRNGVGPSNMIPGNEYHTPKLFSEKALKCTSSADADDFSEVNTRRPSKGWKRWSFLSDSDVFCCVCGSSIKDDVNQLLECNHCLIRVHQACYGVAKVPKGPWCCRPCKTNSFNTVCVICGYGGGAMTRALNSQILVKSLLNVWKVGAGSNLLKSLPSSEGTYNEFSKPGSECVPSDNAYKSIIAGIFDTSITQWVHMVCGLWTPGTRCPNVDTMSTFDVSGASPAQESNVCSICNRPGGSCIVCRVPNCSVQFHPWCAHQKGLLQSEIEGDNNEKVGFYGRCMFHATQGNSLIQNDPVDARVGSPKDEDWTCSRMEGFKGRKRDEGFNPYHKKPYNDGGGCVVSQEQINAWLHINAQKPYTRGVVKAPCSDMEHDVRKEYMRYKQAKGWKSLVVYKSGIHALGLYTSQFIARGAMVVEYVGEIVGLRVADKREIEYQSGRRLQYKSACYFFRIDKEHIIDATRKGGIARFVNHSCLPNCVAKVISVRNEKKVVFFAERDIYPGEEITYDYHFNHEDEGEKIPCFCNSKNCRRSLN